MQAILMLSSSSRPRQSAATSGQRLHRVISRFTKSEGVEPQCVVFVWCEY